MILFYMVLRYGGYFMMMTGGCLLMGNILYANIRNAFELVIPFRDGFLEFTGAGVFGSASLMVRTVLRKQGWIQDLGKGGV